MSTLKEQAEVDIDMFMETGLPWIDQAVFTPQIGDPVSLNVIFEQEEYDNPEDFQTTVSGIQYRAEMLIKDISKTPIAKTSTRAGDLFTINDIEYEVTGIIERDNNFIVCALRPI